MARTAAEVIKLAFEIYGEGTVLWLRSRNRLLEGQTPEDFMRQHRTDEVYAVLAAIADGPVM